MDSGEVVKFSQQKKKHIFYVLGILYESSVN